MARRGSPDTESDRDQSSGSYAGGQAPAAISELTATSVSDEKRSAKAIVILSPAVGLSVTPARVVLMPGETIGFEANLIFIQ